jgi:RNA polymerase sigma factor (TIGR02999 family)
LADKRITGLLKQVSDGERRAADELLPLVYRELKRVAHHKLKAERRGHTFNTTALVHEAYLRLGLEKVVWQDRVHFFAVAARAMRRVLIDHAKARAADKRGGGTAQVPVDETIGAPERRVEDLLALDEALNHLERLEPRQARVVECHVFAGMSLEDTAVALGISAATVSRDWTLARAWLNRALKSSQTRNT